MTDLARQKGDHLIYGLGHSSKINPITLNGKKVKEYETWRGMLKRCYDEQYLLRQPTYNECFVSDEWLYYDNFYSWVTSQTNYANWKNSAKKWAIDKDIKYKGNKIYSSDTCFLVPQNVNNLFTNRKLYRGQYPLGVRYFEHLLKYGAYCMNPFTKKDEHLGLYLTQEEAFNAYKQYKENIIKLVAEQEYKNGNITEECMLAMKNYQIEIND